MTFIENINEAIRSLQINRLRTLLTMLGIVFGVGALITMLSLGAGAQISIREQINSLGANLVMVVPRLQPNTGAIANSQVRPIQLTMNDVKAIRDAIPAALATAPALQGDVSAVFKNRNWATRINGTSTDYFFIRDWPLQAGRIFSFREEQTAGKFAVIGATVAEQLFGTNDPIGQQVRLSNVPVTIIGVLTKKGQSSSGRDQDDIIFMPYKTVLLRFGQNSRKLAPDLVSYILIKATSNDQVSSLKNSIEQMLLQRHHVAAIENMGVSVVDPVEAMIAQRGSTRTIAWLLAAIAFISLIVGGISIMNIMLVSVTERTREIGLRRALGARQRDISSMFLLESLLICLIGGALGIFYGVLSSWLIAGLFEWPILIAPSTVLFAFLSSAIIGIFFGFFPARKAALLPPTSALRSE